MFNPNTVSLHDKLLQSELVEFKNTFFDIESQNVGEEFVKGHTLFRALPNRTSFQNIIKRSRVVIKRSLNRIPAGHSYTEMSLANAMTSINKIKIALGSKFYGALLIKGKVKINPLHPLVAMSLVSSEEAASLPKQWKVAVFVYKDRDKLDTLYKSSSADPKIIEENLRDLINIYANRVDTVTKVITSKPIGDGDKLELSYVVENHVDSDHNGEAMAVAHQLLTNGIIIPYYGTSLLKMTPNSTSGLNVSPMISSNISHDFSLADGTGFDLGGVPAINVRYSSVCTGSQSNKTLKGLRTLTHSNTLSPYNRSIITDGSLPFVEACNNKSIEIFKLANVIKAEPENDKDETEPTPQEPENPTEKTNQSHEETTQPVESTRDVSTEDQSNSEPTQAH